MRDLVEVADGPGLRTSKQELLAALVCAADPAEDAVTRALTTYRTALARDVTIRDTVEGT